MNRHTREHYSALVAHYLAEHYGTPNAAALVALQRQTIDTYWAAGARVRAAGEAIR